MGSVIGDGFLPMRFTATFIPELYVVDLEPHVDERGFFARIWCEEELQSRGLVSHCAQISLSVSTRRGTLRGMHYQQPPQVEAKYVRVLRGSIHDVVLDLREDSPAWGRWFALELNAAERRALLIPPGCAHGYVTLADDTELLYLMSCGYQVDAARGIHWAAEALRGAWPLDPVVISPQDSRWPRQLVKLPVVGRPSATAPADWLARR